MSFDLKTLEFAAITTKIQTYALSQVAKNEIQLLMPQTSKDEILRRFLEIESLLGLIVKWGKLPVSSLDEIETLLSFIEKEHQLTPEEAYDVYQLLLTFDSVSLYLKQAKQKETLHPLLEEYRFRDTSLILKSFDQVFDHDGTIKDDASIQLKSIRRSIKQFEKNYHDVLIQSLQQYQSYLTDTLIVNRGDASCIGVAASYKNQVKGIILDQSSTGQTIYIEPQKAYETRLSLIKLKEEEKIEIIKICAYLTSKSYDVIDVLIDNTHKLRWYDVTQAKALYALEIDAHPPHISDRDIHLLHARHPLIDQSVCVPITIHLTHQEKGMMITGSNTGGKTVALKTLGLLQVMAQSGLWISAHPESSIVIFEDIEVDIGDQQSIVHNLSTFSGHLVNIIRMLEHAHDKKLVILDEIGSGTDPQEGVALAVSMMNHFLHHQTWLFVTTHYSELKSYALEVGMKIASVSFDEVSLKPKYQLIEGVSGASHAFDIAKRLGMQNELIEDAKRYYEHTLTDTQKIMRAISDEKQKLDLEKQAINETLNIIEKQKEQLNQEQTLFEHYKKRAIENELKLQLHDITELKSKLQNAIKDAESKSKLSFNESSKLKSLLNEQVEANIPSKDVIVQLGDDVYIPTYDQYGKITSIKNDQYKVQVGMIEMTLKKEDIIKSQVQMPKKTKTPKPIQHTVIEKRYIQELDLRGFRYEEVKDALESAIDQALLSHQESLRIIHGFGTGAVRKAVYAIIEKHPHVATHRFGQEGEGLNGVTIITFK